MAIKKTTYSMPRGDTRTLPVSIPTSVYSAGASIFFTMKKTIDADVTDANAVVKKTLTDSNITSTTATAVNYLLTLTPADTTNVTPDTYRAEFEYVSADKSDVITYPDPNVSLFYIQITGDVGRRTS